LFAWFCSCAVARAVQSKGEFVAPHSTRSTGIDQWFDK
jgi:hypothetical protein